MSLEWKPINQASKTPSETVLLRNDDYAPFEPFYFENGRWTTKVASAIGWVTAVWDVENCGEPTEFAILKM